MDCGALDYIDPRRAQVAVMNPWPPPKRILAREFAKVCADQGEEMSVYRLEEARSFMWGMCAERYLLPRVERIHAMLVQIGASEKNELDFNDLDDHAFFIPVTDTVKEYGLPGEPRTYTESIKVFVYRTQNRDYLFILIEELGRKTLHIRRIWWKFDADYFDGMKKPKTLREMMDHVDDIEQFTDYPRVDDSQRRWFSSRPSLEVYRDLGFRIPTVSDKPFEQICFYGDCRDRGYILSYASPLEYDMESKAMRPPLECEFIKAEYVSPDASIIMSCYLPFLERTCEEALKEKEACR